MTTDGWDERTEAIPGTKGDKSFELDVDFGADAAQPTHVIARPGIVVFEPAPIGLAAALAALGYDVRSGATGVDVMGLVSGHVPAAVVCAPSPDSERRRLLAAALRLRFPHVPVLYVSTHAGHEEAVLGAIREGARAVIAWPLPPGPDVARVLAPYLDVEPPPAGVDEEAIVTPPRPIPRPATFAGEGENETKPFQRASPTKQKAVAPPASSEDFEDARTDVTDRHAAVVAAGRSDTPGSRAAHPSRVELPINQVPQRKAAPAPVLSRSDEPITEPGLRPAPQAAVEAQREKRGEIGALLAAISPFLWSLEDAARWADALAEAGDASAKNHAKALHLLAKILAQLQARIDESGA